MDSVMCSLTHFTLFMIHFSLSCAADLDSLFTDVFSLTHCCSTSDSQSVSRRLSASVSVFACSFLENG